MNPSDPRLTAYAPGELSDDERERFERELGRNRAADAEIVAITELARVLECAYAERPFQPEVSRTPAVDEHTL